MATLHVLMIDDNLDNVRLIREMLREAKRAAFALTHADRLEVGIEHLKKAYVDVLLLDPGMSGGQNLNALETVFEEAPTVPVVVLIDSGNETSALRAMRLGAQDYLIKEQIAPSLLAHTLRHAIERKRVEEKLADGLRFESQRTLVTLMSSLPGMAYRCLNTPRWTMMFVSEGCLPLTGYKQNDLVDDETVAYGDLIVGEDRQRVWDEIQVAIEQGKPFEIIYRIITAAGQEKWVWERGQAVHEDEGGIILEGFISDITKRKHIEKALQQSEAKYREITENLPGVVFQFVMSLDTGEYYFENAIVNEYVVARTGITASTLLNDVETHLNQIPPEDFMRYTQVLEESARNMTSYSIEYRVRRSSDDEILWLNARATPRRLADHRIMWTGIAIDITERKRAEEALARERDLLHSLMDNIPDYIYFKDTEGKFTRVNQAQAEILGVEDPQLVTGMTDADFLPNDLAEETRADEQTIINTGHPQVGKVERIAEMDTVTRWVTATKVPIADESGQITGIVGISRDITALKQAEQAERDQRELAEALAASAKAINSTLQLDQVLEHILANVSRVVPHDASEIWLIGKDDIARVVGCRGYAEHDSEEALLSLQLAVNEIPNMRKSREDRAPVIIDDVSNFDGWVETDPVDWIGSMVTVPIEAADHVIGFLSVVSETSAFFTNEHSGRLQVFASQAATAIRNAQLFAQAEERASYLAALNQASHRVSRWSLDLEGVLKAITSSLVEEGDAACARIWIADKNGETLVLRASAGLSTTLDGANSRIRIDDTALKISQIARQGRPYVTNKVREEVEFDQEWVKEKGIGAFAGYPLSQDEHLSSVLAVFHTEPLPDVALDMLGLFVNQAAIAIENAILYEEVESYSSYLQEAVEERTAELLVVKERVESILTHSPDAIVLLSPDGFIETTNPSFSTMFGYETDELFRQPSTQLVCSDDIARCRQVLSAIAEGDSPQQVELTARRKDGSTFDAQAVLGAIKENNNLVSIVCSMRDITALKDVERMKDEFLSTAAHELRTPLTSIQGFSEILLTRDLEPGRQERYLKMVNTQSSQLAAIIDKLLDLSRLEAKQHLQFETELTQVGSLTEEALQMFIGSCPNHNFTITGLDTLPLVNVDRFRFIQVVRNLVSNAVKFSPNGGDITIRGRLKSDSIEINVQDEGIGMTPDQQAHLFEKFYRADPSSTPGTGLGLVISKLIIEEHGGQIWVESRPEKGAIVSFTLPFTEMNSV